ncbi:MAG: hypothetical protein AB7E76_08095 [Deferribacterales bacterium]
MNNRDLLIRMATALKPMLDKFVFVGGCAVDLLVTSEAVNDVRITNDVDVIAEIATQHQYYELIDQLKELGFNEKMPTPDDNSPICRLIKEGMLLDVMPTDESVLGFSNIWYLPALKNARKVSLTEDITVKVVTSAYFIATKLMAFRTRGESDYYCHDMEDIITVFNGNDNIVEDIRNAEDDVREYIKKEFSELMTDRLFKINCLPAHLATESPKRAELVYERIKDAVS